MRRHVPAVQLAVRAAAAAALSLVLARALGLPLPIYAMIAAVIVTDLAPPKTRSLAWQRTLGTIVGALIGACVSLAAEGPVAIALGIFAAMLACMLAELKDAAKLAGYVCGITLLEHAGEPWLYASLRLAETLLGIGVAVAVSLVPKLVATREAARPPTV